MTNETNRTRRKFAHITLHQSGGLLIMGMLSDDTRKAIRGSYGLFLEMDERGSPIAHAALEAYRAEGVDLHSSDDIAVEVAE